MDDSFVAHGIQHVEMFARRPLDIDELVRRVSRLTGISADEIMSQDRHQRVAYARQLCVFAVRILTGMSFPEIGRIFDREHATCIHAVRRVSVDLRRRPMFAKTVYAMLEDLDSTSRPESRQSHILAA
jgi:chromosomal replication initiator protein